MENKNLRLAKKNKKDEFYTLYSTIEDEMKYYTQHFKGKIVYCNCDDYRWSNFVKYFKDNYHKLGLSGLYATNYDIGDGAYKYYYDGFNEVIEPLSGNGSYDSQECLEVLKKADLVVTNPPFSVFRDYFKILIENKKKFVIIGNKNSITYKEVFSHIKSNELYLGNTIPNGYFMPNGDVTQKLNGLCRWFTNIPHIKTEQALILTKTYNPKDYPKYDNYDAIEVSKVVDIPIDYDGIMGVPITLIDKYCPNQFEIIKFRKGNDDKDLSYNGNTPYLRILIKKNNSLEPVEFEILWLASGHSKTSMPSNLADLLKANFELKSKENTGNGYAILNDHQLYHRIFIKRKQSHNK